MKRHMPILWGAMILVGGSLALHEAIGAPSPSASEKNLIVNPSFEREAGKNPFGWLSQAKAPRYIKDGKEGVETHTGTHAVELATPDDFNERWAVSNPQMIQVSGGERLQYSAWVKVSGFEGEQFVQLRFEQFDAKGKPLPQGPGSAYLFGDKHRPDEGQWVRITDTFTTHANARKIRPLLVLATAESGSTATASFDDIELVKAPK